MLKNITLLDIFVISAGAIPGALSRYYLNEYCKRAFGSDFPYGTFIINFTGCLLMGFLFPLFRTVAPRAFGIENFPLSIDLLVRVGFLGSYTTFSTYGYDTLTLWRNNKKGATIFYWLGSAVLGVIGIGVGGFLADRLILFGG